MTAVPGRRAAIADALSECPVGRWVCFDDFGRFMQVEGFDFVVNRDPWNLYLAEPEYGSLGYDGSHDWAIIEGRYALCLLFEYAAHPGPDRRRLRRAPRRAAGLYAHVGLRPPCRT